MDSAKPKMPTSGYVNSDTVVPGPTTSASPREEHGRLEDEKTKSEINMIDDRKLDLNVSRSMKRETDELFTKSCPIVYAEEAKPEAAKRMEVSHHKRQRRSRQNEGEGEKCLTSTKRTRPAKYNFCNDIDGELSQDEKIDLLYKKMNKMQKIYKEIKEEVARIDKRRRELQKKKR